MRLVENHFAKNTVKTGSMQSFHSAKERFGVDVCVTNEDLTKAPECPHGRH